MTAYKRVSHAINQLRDEINAAHLGRSKVSDGTLGDTAHASRKSDHNPDADGIVHAIDVTVWDSPDADTADDVAGPLAEFLRASRDRRIKYVIHRGRMFSSYGSQAWQWRPYTGPNGHFHHVHVSVYGDDGAPWGYASRKVLRTGWTPPPFPGTIKAGSPKERVALVRLLFGALGYTGFKVGIYPWSGVLGFAVRRFQRRHGLLDDGIVGPKTYAKAVERYEQTRNS